MTGRGTRRAACGIACVLLAILGCASSAPSTPSAPPAPSAPASGIRGESSPSWLDGLIAQIQKQPVTNPPTAIYRYGYRGDTVYYRISRCCDIRSVVYDRDGAVLCEPDGGIVAKADPRCPDFLEKRTEKTLVFQDPRR